jgi:DNA primase
MTLDEFLPLLENVTPRGSRSMATCPAHADKTPSLQISEGDKGLLLKCWAGCSLMDICQSLGIDQQDLFFDALDPDPHKRRAAARKREHEQQVCERHADQQGTLIDALREADYFVQTRRNLDISSWSDNYLQRELDALADARGLLEKENLDGQLG